MISLNGAMGVLYHVPFPVLARAGWGFWGSYGGFWSGLFFFGVFLGGFFLGEGGGWGVWLIEVKRKESADVFASGYNIKSDTSNVLVCNPDRQRR